MGLMRRLAAFFVLFGGKVREAGLRHVAYLVARTVMPRLALDFRRILVIALDPRSVPPEVPDDPDIREISEGDLGPALDPGNAEAQLRGRLRAGHRVWVVGREGRIVAHDFLGGGSRAISDWLVVNGDAGDIWSEFIHVARDFRGQGLGPRLRAHVARHCARAGVSRMLGSIDSPNRNSTRALGKVGYVPVGRIFFVRILGLILVHYGPTWRVGRWTAERPLVVPVGATGGVAPGIE